MLQFWYSLFKPSVNKLSEKRDVRGLIWALGQPDDSYYQHAAQAHVTIGPEAFISLRATLRDPNEDSLRRENAAWAVGRLLFVLGRTRKKEA